MFSTAHYWNHLKKLDFNLYEAWAQDSARQTATIISRMPTRWSKELLTQWQLLQDYWELALEAASKRSEYQLLYCGQRHHDQSCKLLCFICCSLYFMAHHPTSSAVDWAWSADSPTPIALVLWEGWKFTLQSATSVGAVSWAGSFYRGEVEKHAANHREQNVLVHSKEERWRNQPTAGPFGVESTTEERG